MSEKTFRKVGQKNLVNNLQFCRSLMNVECTVDIEPMAVQTIITTQDRSKFTCYALEGK